MPARSGEYGTTRPNPRRIRPPDQAYVAGGRRHPHPPSAARQGPALGPESVRIHWSDAPIRWQSRRMRTEPIDKRVRGIVGDMSVVDSRRPLLFWEDGFPVPNYAY